MTLATNLRTAARNLIDQFGNDADLYSFASATVTENEEGDVTVTSWGVATVIKVVDGTNLKDAEVFAPQGKENIGEDDKVIRDDATVAVNDRMTIDSEEYRVVSVRPTRTQDTLVIQTIEVAKVTGTSTWV